MATLRHASSATGRLSPPPKKSAFAASSIGRGFPPRRSPIALARRASAIDDVDCLALNQDSRANLGAKLAYLVKSRPSLSMVFDRVKNRGAREGAPELLRAAYPKMAREPRIEHVEHHLAHLSSAFHVSPFEEAVVVSVDGFGDFASAAWGVGEARPSTSRAGRCSRIRSAFSIRRSRNISAFRITATNTK